MARQVPVQQKAWISKVHSDFRRLLMSAPVGFTGSHYQTPHHVHHRNGSFQTASLHDPSIPVISLPLPPFYHPRSTPTLVLSINRSLFCCWCPWLLLSLLVRLLTADYYSSQNILTSPKGLQKRKKLFLPSTASRPRRVSAQAVNHLSSIACNSLISLTWFCSTLRPHPTSFFRPRPS
ncbi:uncharacterized protein BDV14DRAFT_103972 [Aspergillus stella-maris]|uniref:uncharacterized protein n=1 Tax=Aspergillus stella-maris TaxID=1810926 RepID=UPI003CCE1997